MRLVQSRSEGGGVVQRVRQADDGKPRAVVGVVLDGVRHDVQAELGGGPFAGQCSPGRVGGRQACTFGVAGDRAALDMRQVLGQPGLALGESLGVCEHGLDALDRGNGAQQVVAHQQADLAHDMRGGVQKQVEGPGDHTFDRIFDTHNAELRAARGGGVEDFIEVGAVDNVGGTTKEFDGGLLAEGALGAPERRRAGATRVPGRPT